MLVPSRPLLPEALLAHEPFVRALAKHLLRSDEQVEDLVQDTWLAALKRPPRSDGSGRAFLATVVRNLVHNRRRDASARAYREQVAARAECVESVAAIHERLGVQRAVVDAVLTLDEPYRGVILLHYYESLNAADIARRRGVPAGTVRAQLSRGLQILRAKLDSRFGGDRGAWSAVLLPWVVRAAPVVPVSGFTSPVLLLGLALLIACAVPLSLLVVSARRPIAAEPALSGLATPSNSRTTIADERPVTGLGQPAGNGRAEAVPPKSSTTVSTRPDLDAKSIEELLALEDRARRAIEKRLCTPDARVLAEQSEFLALPNTGICRLLRPGGKSWSLVGFESKDPPRTYQGYLSDAVRNHPIESQPRFRFSVDVKLRSSVHHSDGNLLGIVAILGSIELSNLPTQATPVPREWSIPSQEAWDLCWSSPSWLESREDPGGDSLWRDAQGLGLDQPVPERTGATFLNRQIDARADSAGPPGSDILAAVRVLQCDADGITLAWRLLRTWSATPPQALDASMAIPPAPDSFEALPLEELTALIHDIHVSATARYIRVAPALEFQFAAALNLPDTSLVRLLPEPHELPRLFSPLWAGIDYTPPPVKQGETRGASPTGEMSSRDPRDWYDMRRRGWILDLGSVPLTTISQSARSVPSTLDAAQREVWELIWTEEQQEWTAYEQRRPARVPLNDLFTAAAHIGHTYLTRIDASSEGHSRSEGSSVLMAFTLVDRDEGGDTLLLRTLRTFSLPPRRVR